MTSSKVNVVHAQSFLCVKSSAFFKVKCRAFSFRKMFNFAGTFFWSNIFAPFCAFKLVQFKKLELDRRDWGGIHVH